MFVYKKFFSRSPSLINRRTLSVASPDSICFNKYILILLRSIYVEFRQQQNRLIYVVVLPFLLLEEYQIDLTV